MIRLFDGRGGPSGPAAGEFTIELACAVQDRGFTATFARRAGETLYRPVAVTPIARRGLLARAGALLKGGGPTLRVKAEEVEDLPNPCPGCGLQPCRWCLCAWCHAFVCTARQRGTRFRCRPSCGVSFETQALHAIDASRGPPSGPGGTPSGNGAPRLPGPSPKLLPRR